MLFRSSAYGAFGNNGVKTEAILYRKVIDSTGKVILDKTADTTKLFSKETAYIMYDILKGPVTGLMLVVLNLVIYLLLERVEPLTIVIHSGSQDLLLTTLHLFG